MDVEGREKLKITRLEIKEILGFGARWNLLR